MRISSSARPKLEWLEERNCPAPLNLFFDGLGNLTISGQIDTLNSGGLLITATGVPDTFDITDGALTPIMLGAVVTGNLSIIDTSPADDFVTVDLTLGNLNGDLNVNLGGQELVGDTLDILGPFLFGGVGGNVNLTGVSNPSFLGVSVGGNVVINNSQANVPNTTLVVTSPIGGSFTYLGGSDLDALALTGSSIGGNVLARLGNGSNDFAQDFDVFIGGNLTVMGGNNDDAVVIDGTVGGNVSLNLGNALPPPATGDSLEFGGSGLIGGSLTMVTGIGNDVIDTFNGTVGGSLFFSLGDGDNELDLDGTIGGSSVSIRTGLGNDDVTYSMAGNRARVFASLSLGNDTFTLESLATGTSVGFLYVDFGFGMDTFDNMFGAPFSFPTILRNLP